MKNFNKVFSKTVASVYTAKPLRRFTSQTRMPAGIRKPLRKVYQTRGMQSIPQHHVNRGIGFQTTGMPAGIPEHRIKRGVAL